MFCITLSLLALIKKNISLYKLSLWVTLEVLSFVIELYYVIFILLRLQLKN